MSIAIQDVVSAKRDDMTAREYLVRATLHH